MALAGNIKTQRIDNATYMRIVRADIDYANEQIEVRVFAYRDRDARDAGGQDYDALSKVRLRFSEISTSDPTKADLYAALKLRAPYSTMTDT